MHKPCLRTPKERNGSWYPAFKERMLKNGCLRLLKNVGQQRTLGNKERCYGDCFTPFAMTPPNPLGVGAQAAGTGLVWAIFPSSHPFPGLVESQDAIGRLGEWALVVDLASLMSNWFLRLLRKPFNCLGSVRSNNIKTITVCYLTKGGDSA